MVTKWEKVEMAGILIFGCWGFIRILARNTNVAQLFTKYFILYCTIPY